MVTCPSLKVSWLAETTETIHYINFETPNTVIHALVEANCILCCSAPSNFFEAFRFQDMKKNKQEDSFFLYTNQPADKQLLKRDVAVSSKPNFLVSFSSFVKSEHQKWEARPDIF